jgi:uncharacterized protein
MKKLALILFLIPFVVTQVWAQTTDSKKQEFEMKTYYLVFLKRGLNRSQDSATAAGLQEQHLKHLGKMFEDKKMCIAGPLLDNSEIRGICVYYTETLEEAKKLAEDDPAVKAGRLQVEVHPWYSAKGCSLP